MRPRCCSMRDWRKPRGADATPAVDGPDSGGRTAYLLPMFSEGTRRRRCIGKRRSERFREGPGGNESAARGERERVVTNAARLLESCPREHPITRCSGTGRQASADELFSRAGSSRVAHVVRTTSSAYSASQTPIAPRLDSISDTAVEKECSPCPNTSGAARSWPAGPGTALASLDH